MSVAPEREEVGLIGIGLVGTSLSEHLLARGYGVVGYDLVPQRCEHLRKLGGRCVDGPAAVASRCRRVILSLMTTQIVCDVVEGPGGLLSADTPPRYIIDTTTGDPEMSAALVQRLAARGVSYLDATISGSSQLIRQRDATFMVGGERGAFDACRDLFDALADTVVYVGPWGSGSKAKLAINLIMGLNRAALAEGLVFAQLLGLDLPAFLELIHVTAAQSRVADLKGQKMASGDYYVESRIGQHHKDIALILDYARRLGQELPLTAVHEQLLSARIATGHAEADNVTIIEEIRRRTLSV